jgi:hypothetical protein
VTIRRLRGSALALVAACAAWAGGCATQRPFADPVFASGAYAPARIAVLPPDVFVVLDQVGDNDDAASAALGAQVSSQTVAAVERSLRARGYDVDLSSRWDGIVAQDGQVLVSRDELGWLANGVLQFGNGQGSGAPGVVAPELAAKVGWATRSDALLYVNVKGVATTSGKRAAGVVAAVFIVFIVAAIILALAASSKGGGGGNGSPSKLGGGGGGSPGKGIGAWRGTPSGAGSGGGGTWHGSPSTGSGVGSWRGAPPAASPGRSGGGAWRSGAAPVGSAPVYGGGPRVGFGVGVFVPLDGPVYTHDGSVSHDDELFAGDELYVSMTLVSTYDGRVLWHDRQELDLDADDPADVDRMVGAFLARFPGRGAPPLP